MTLYCGNMGLKKGCKYKDTLPQKRRKKAFRTWRAGSFLINTEKFFYGDQYQSTAENS